MEENLASEVKRLSETLARDPDSIVFASLADLYLKMEMVDEAIKMCLSGLKNHPNYLKGHSVLAEAYLAKGMVHSAKGEYERILELNPNDQSAQARLESRFWEKRKPPTGVTEAELEPEKEEVEASVQEEAEEVARVTAEEEKTEAVSETSIEEQAEQPAEVKAEEAEGEPEAPVEEEGITEPAEAPVEAEKSEMAVDQKIEELVEAAYEAGMEEALKTPLEDEEIEEALKTGFRLGKKAARPEAKKDEATTSAINALIRSFQEIRKEREAPAPTPPVEAEASRLSTIDRALSELLQKPGVSAAILVDSAGLIVESASSPGIDVEETAALASTIFSSSQKTMENLNLGKVDRIAIERSDRRVYMTRAGEHILMVETDMSMRLGLLVVLVKKVSQAVQELTK